MRILEEIGIEFRDDQALATWAQAGANVQGNRVRIDRELLLAKTSLAPGEYIQHARNPDHSVKIGGDHMVFAPVYGSPYVRDLSNNRRYATLQDFRNFVRLTYMSPALSHSGGTICETNHSWAVSPHLNGRRIVLICVAFSSAVNSSTKIR
jgi:trimethylamine--corrinoid protein Co-methyltransferase